MTTERRFSDTHLILMEIRRIGILIDGSHQTDEGAQKRSEELRDEVERGRILAAKFAEQISCLTEAYNRITKQLQQRDELIASMRGNTQSGDPLDVSSSIDPELREAIRSSLIRAREQADEAIKRADVLEAEAVTLRDERNKARQDVEEIRASNSWKVTAPIRAVTGLFRR